MPRDLLSSLLTEVSRVGFGFRHLAPSRSGRPPLDAPAQPAAVLRSTRSEPQAPRVWAVPPAGTALLPARWWERAMPPPHHTRVRGRLMQKAAEGLRLAVDEQLLPGTDREGRGGEGIEPGARLSFGRGARGQKQRVAIGP